MATESNSSEAKQPRRSRKAYRKRLLCRDDVLSMPERAGEEPMNPPDYSTSFTKDSTCHLTWGVLNFGPTFAISKPRRYQGLKARKETARLKREAKSNPALVEKPAYPLLSNLPMELREIVYGHLLISNAPIILHPDWCEVQRNAGLDLGILRVCKKINEEATNFLYQRNTFHALVRDNSAISRFDQCLYPSYVYLFRNVVIEHTKETSSLAWMQDTANSIRTLIASDVALDSITLAFAPRAPSKDPAASDTEDPMTFANFFTEGSRVIRLLAQLRCRVINIVVKLEGMTRVVVSLDVRHLDRDYSKSPFANDPAARAGRLMRTEKAKMALSGLKLAVDKIASNWEEAVELGVCRVMEEGEDLSDEAALKRV
ncbi:hypothetical protein VE01_03170 [Pseudogymnoascus verrucosus]|uniref:F-box domain-containing protein n=1 Tax=Pseudogymnoascus verrucosus TaxID=342668 RepID=A0A1B8GR67_9PEZI|nr:uncharacterized protein VE01_03170 [Pseudogymnoascus verrucosus]OBT98318.1 hypothetical protein VE01_03170 [Pseudogymnoascus verrucosus]